MPGLWQIFWRPKIFQLPPALLMLVFKVQIFDKLSKMNGAKVVFGIVKEAIYDGLADTFKKKGAQQRRLGGDVGGIGHVDAEVWLRSLVFKCLEVCIESLDVESALLAPPSWNRTSLSSSSSCPTVGMRPVVFSLCWMILVRW